MRARAHADNRALRLSAGEQDHRRDREHVVPRRDSRLLVDVQARDVDGKLLEDWLERLARPAPRRPEVDEQRAARDRLVERRLVELLQSRPLNAANRSAGTFQTASSTIDRLILELPAVRSTNRIGTSTTRKPLRNVWYVVSIWKT